MIGPTSTELVRPPHTGDVINDFMPGHNVATARVGERLQALRYLGIAPTGLRHIYLADDWGGEGVGPAVVKVFGEPTGELERQVDNELRGLERYNHQPGIVSTRAMGTLMLAGENGTRRFVVAPLARDGSLIHAIPRQRGRDLRLALRTGIQIFAALDTMHKDGVIHGDVKPDNILLDGPDSLLTDLQLMQPIAEIEAPTVHKGLGALIVNSGITLPNWDGTDGLRGTPRYMAAEAITHDSPIGPGVDTYAMTLTMVVDATGKLPTSSRRGMELEVVNEGPVRASDFTERDLPASFDEIVMAGTEHDPRNRATPREIVSVLKAILYNEVLA